MDGPIAEGTAQKKIFDPDHPDRPAYRKQDGLVRQLDVNDLVQIIWTNWVDWILKRAV